MGVDRFHGRSTLDRNLRVLAICSTCPNRFLLRSHDQQTLVAGASALRPKRTGAETRTQIYGVDLYWKWKPPTLSPASLSCPGRRRRFTNASKRAPDPSLTLPAETLRDWGCIPRSSGFQTTLGGRSAWRIRQWQCWCL